MQRNAVQRKGKEHETVGKQDQHDAAVAVPAQNPRHTQLQQSPRVGTELKSTQSINGGNNNKNQAVVLRSKYGNAPY